MAVEAFLGSLSLGAISGLVGPIVSAISNYKMLKLKNEHEIAKIEAETNAMIAEVNANIQISRVETEGEIQLAELGAFVESQKQGNKDLVKKSYIDQMLEKNSKVAGFLVFMFAVVDFLKGLARPAITYYLIGLTTWITWKCYVLITTADKTISITKASMLFEAVILFIVYLCGTVVGWWFGSRGSSKFLAELTGNKKKDMPNLP